MITDSQIQDITKVIVETVQPKRVYLIGSYANGMATINSDIDFLIVAESKGLPKFERTGRIQKKLFHYPDFSIDLTMFSEEEIVRREKNELSFIGHSLKNGKLLYEA